MKFKTSLLLLNFITIAYTGLSDLYEDFLSKPQYQLYFSAEKWGPKILKVKEDSGSSIIKLPVNKDGLTYACEIEKPLESKKTVSQENNENAILSKALEQLEPLASGSCFIYNQEWWSYEFCYKKYINQYHEAKPTDPPEHNMHFCIGKYPTPEELENPDFEYQKETYKRGPFGKNYISQMMIDGTICSVTGKPRRTELRFYCGASESVQSVKEISTCNYIVFINTPKLCNNPGFDSKKSLNSILCHPVSDHDEEEKDEINNDQPKDLPFPVFRRRRSMAEIERSKENPKKIYKRKGKKHQGVTFIKNKKNEENDENEQNQNSDDEKESEERHNSIKKNLEDQLEKKRNEFLDALLPYANELNIDDNVVDGVLNQLADSLADAIDKTTDKDSEKDIKADDLSFEVVTKEKLKSWLEKHEDKISNTDDMKFEVVLLDKNGKRYEVSNSDTDVDNIMEFLKEFSTDNSNVQDINKIKRKAENKLEEEKVEEVGIEKENKDDDEKRNTKQEKINKDEL